MSIIKEVGLPKRPPQGRSDEGQDLSERVPPPRSSSPVIGSPPVRAVPIGTPPKQPMSHALNHQVTRNCVSFVVSTAMQEDQRSSGGVKSNFLTVYSVVIADNIFSNSILLRHFLGGWEGKLL